MKSIFQVLAVAFLFALPMAGACINSRDSFAVEVEFNKQGITDDLSKISSAENVFSENKTYIFQSEYDKEIASLVFRNSDDLCEGCVSLRMQIPVDSSTKKVPYFSMISSLPEKEINLTWNTHYKDWTIFYSDNPSQIEFKKEKMYILISFLSRKRELFIELDDKLEDCSECDGKCIHSSYGESCITKEIKEEIEDVLGYYNVISNFGELFYDYRIIGNGEKTASDLSPVASSELDLKRALEVELNFLQQSGVIGINYEDIRQIAALAQMGKAGKNYRIVYSPKNKRWIYYFQIDNPILTSEPDCRVFLPDKIPQEKIIFKKSEMSVYYSVPLFILISALILIIILIAIGRMVNRNHPV
ncbi:hypothetical protein HYW76_01945 [Candidatus Pacearchaeota archaeon]|nr:hypothetical protein [Candidatus Pacearchaeota archaeon]